MPPKKPQVNKKDPRMAVRGQVVWSKQAGVDEVVRGVSVVLHLANGTDEVYKVGEEEIEVLAEQPQPLTLTDIPEEEPEDVTT